MMRLEFRCRRAVPAAFYLVISLLLCHPPALAEDETEPVIQCRPIVSPKPGLECQNLIPGGGTVITTRHMPSWGSNAGMMLIDICPRQLDEDESALSEGVAIRPLNEREMQAIPSSPGASCLRRLCTEKIREFAISVHASPIWIGSSVFLGVELGFANSRFTLECGNFVDPYRRGTL